VWLGNVEDQHDASGLLYRAFDLYVRRTTQLSGPLQLGKGLSPLGFESLRLR
jgi:hypothetical protein